MIFENKKYRGLGEVFFKTKDTSPLLEKINITTPQPKINSLI